MSSALGTPGDPQFVEAAVKGHIINNDGVTRKQIVNVFHYNRGTKIGAPTLATFEAAFVAKLQADYAACLSVALVGDVVTCRFIDSPTLIAMDFATPFPGAVGGDNQPSNESAYMLLRSDTRGKHYRGSKHFGPIAESSTLNQELAAGVLAAWATFATHVNDIITDATGTTWFPIVLSRTLSDLTVTPASLVYALITNVFTSKTLGTMRHRKERSRY